MALIHKIANAQVKSGESSQRYAPTANQLDMIDTDVRKALIDNIPVTLPAPTKVLAYESINAVIDRCLLSPEGLPQRTKDYVDHFKRLAQAEFGRRAK